jgi:hypothetical protein
MISSNSLEGDYQFSYLKNKNKIHNIFCSFKIGIIMAVLTEKTLEEILSYLEKSMDNLTKEAFKNLEFDEGFQGVENFLQNQFDIRLENLLLAKSSSIHHLESGMKNKVIQRKQRILEQISKKYKN